MDISTTASRGSSTSSVHNHPVNPRYKSIFQNTDRWHCTPKQRLETNARTITSLRLSTQSTIASSYFFRYGQPQQDNKRFQEVFIKFFQEMRGLDPLVHSSADSLASKFGGYPDVSRTVAYQMDAGDFSDIQGSYRSPTPELLVDLKHILEEEYGLKDQLLETLKKNNHRFSEEFQLENRDTCFREFPLFPRMFPKCIDALKDVLSNLLQSKWLENDIAGVKLYLDANDYIDRPMVDPEGIRKNITLWVHVKHAIEHQLKKDQKLNQQFKQALKDDVKNLAISGGLSFCTGNPAFFAGGVGRTIINTLGNYVDPEGKQSDIQLIKVLGGGWLGALLGGNPHDLFTGLSVDLIDLAHRPENMDKNGSTAWNTGTAFLKSIATVDGKKFVAQMLGHAVSEAAERVDEKDAPLDIKIALALLKNPDTRGFIIDDIMKEFSKEKPKQTPIEPELTNQPTEEELAEYKRKLAEYEKWEKDVAHYNEQQRLSGLTISSKETEVKQAEKTMLKWWDKYQKAQGVFSSGSKEFNKYWKKRETYKKLSGELNTLKAQQGLPTEDPFQKFIRKPTKPKGFLGVLDRAYDKTCDVAKKIGLGPSEVTVGSMNLYETKPSTVSDNYVPMGDSYRPPVNQPRPNLGWENVQAMQIEQIFTANMQRSIENSGAIGNTFQAPHYQLSLMQDLAPNMQLPPTDFSNLGRNEIVPYQNSQRNIPIQMAAFVPFEPMLEPSEAMHSIFVNDFTKSLPKGAAKVMAAVCTLMLPDMSDVKGAEDPREHFKRTFNYGLKEYDRFVDIQDPNSFGAKAGEFVGEMVALGGVGKVIRVAEGISVIGMACEGGFCGAIMSEAHDTNKVAGIAFGVVGGGVGAKLLFRGGGVSKPLLDRALIKPQRYSKEYNIIRAFNDPGYRSGFVSDKTLEKLRNSVSQISPRQLKSLENRVSNWLGDGTRLIKNKAGDPIFLSQDNLRRVRFDFNNSHGDKMHLHFEKRTNIKWIDASSKHRIYPKDV